MQPPELTTERLVLDRLGARDAGAFCGYRALPEVCRCQSFAPADAGDAARFIASIERAVWGVPGTWSQLAVRERG